MMNNSDILFIYDARTCNPNGDPDDENKPRIDILTKKNIVTDVRLKRYIRDYLQREHEIFVSKVDGKTVDATNRLKLLFKKHEKDINIQKIGQNDIDWLLSQLIDIRFFGATMPIKAGEEGKKGAQLQFIGPIQFNWGYSLNEVDIMPSSGITSTFAGRGEEHGSMGKDYRLFYSLISFHGQINGKRSEATGLTVDDIEIFDDALLKAIPSEATTRSKIGQMPRLFIRIEYTENIFLGDLRRYVDMGLTDEKMKETLLRDIRQLKLDVTELIDKISLNKDKIKTVYLWQDEELKTVYNDKVESIKELLGKKGIAVNYKD